MKLILPKDAARCKAVPQHPVFVIISVSTPDKYLGLRFRSLAMLYPCHHYRQKLPIRESGKCFEDTLFCFIIQWINWSTIALIPHYMTR